MRKCRTFVWIVAGIVAAFAPLAVALDESKPLEERLAGVTFSDGWKCKGTPAVYDSKNLYELIDGEAELYIPYGFKKAVTVEYVSASDPDQTLAAEVYEVGTLLDAFGVYSNFRNKESRSADAGAEGFMGSTELMFYQDRYFAKIRVSGKSMRAASELVPCSHGLGRVLSDAAVRPAELRMIEVQNVVPKTEQYLAQSVLGYDFFPMGLVADVVLGGTRARIFVVIDINARNARQTLARYQDYLNGAKAHSFVREETFGEVLCARDPLFKGVVAKQVRNCVIGVAKLADVQTGIPLLKQLDDAVIAFNK